MNDAGPTYCTTTSPAIVGWGYLATEQPDGTIILMPAVVMTELEAKFLANRALVERIEENRRHPERLVRRPTGSESTGDEAQPGDASNAS